jgi:hypothetical protein
VRSALLHSSLALLLGSCTPDVGTDVPPEAMQFEPAATPPRVPEPTHVIINPGTRHIDFALGGVTVPPDCAAATIPIPRAQCEFYQYLQSLDGYPTTTPARAPATAALDPATLTLANVVVVDAAAMQVVSEVRVDFDASGKYVVVTPVNGWGLGRLYLVGVRGYASGVKATSGREVVASVPYYLLKRDNSISCGAETPADVSDSCAAYALLAGSMGDAAARASVVQLEALRGSYNQLHATELLGAVGGIPEAELAVFWAFPTHSAPVAELDPKSGKVPQVMGDHELRVAVKGTLDPATLTATVAGKPGTVTLLDLTAAAAGNLIAGLPSVTVSYEGGAVVLRTKDPLVAKHQYGVFLSTGITSTDGKGLVPSPVSFLLTARGPLVDAAGKSTVSSVADLDAMLLEMGRASLADLFDNPLIGALTGLDRAKTAYVYAFPYGAP